MKQMKVKDPRLQAVLDKINGWQQWALVAGAWLTAIVLLYIAWRMK